MRTVLAALVVAVLLCACSPPTPAETLTPHDPVAAEPRADAPVPGHACSAAIGPAVPEPPTTAEAQAAPGDLVAIVVRCPAGVQVVDLVVTLPPPDGVVAILGTTPVMDRGQPLWAHILEVPTDLTGRRLQVWPWADGAPAGQPVALVVEEQTEQQ